MGIEIKRQKLPDGETLFIVYHNPAILTFTHTEFEHLCRAGLSALSDDFNEKRDLSKEVTGENKNGKKA